MYPNSNIHLLTAQLRSCLNPLVQYLQGSYNNDDDDDDGLSFDGAL